VCGLSALEPIEGCIGVPVLVHWVGLTGLAAAIHFAFQTLICVYVYVVSKHFCFIDNY